MASREAVDRVGGETHVLAAPHDLAGYAQFITGVARGEQLLVGWGGPTMFTVLWFDADGEFMRASSFPPDDGQTEDELRDTVQQPLLFDWLRSIGYRPGPIRVTHFSIEEPLVARIEDLTEFDREFLYDPTIIAEQWVRERRLANLTQWRESGGFILVWGEHEFTVEGDGRIV